MGRCLIVRATLALSLVAPAACDIPRDPGHSLEHATGDTLRVGVTEARPWVERAGDEPRGVEPQLVRAFARSIDAEIEWSWGSAEEHMEALKHYELDVVIGGLSRATPWKRHVALTEPYHVSHLRVAGPPGTPPVTGESLDGRTVRARPGGPTAALIREEGGDPRVTEELAGDSGLVAAPDWELAALGRDTTGLVFSTTRHVMAVPSGENALLMALEDVLHRADVNRLLSRVPGGAL